MTPQEWRKATFEAIQDAVMENMETRVGPSIQRLAKGKAPVRKTRLYERKGAKSGLTADYVNKYGQVEEPKVAVPKILIANNFSKKDVSLAMTGRFQGIGLKPGHLKKAGYTLRPEGKSAESAKGSAIGTITREKKTPGLFFNDRKGRFQLGGRLRESIHADEDVVFEGRHRFSISCVADVPYAWAVEFGRQVATGSDGKNRGTTKAQPFMIPALMETYEDLPRLLGLKER